MKHHLSFSILIAGLFVLELVPPFAQAAPLELISPDQQLVVHFSTKSSANGGGGALFYSATFHGKPILDDSALGLELSDQPALGSNVRIVDSSPGSGIDDYTLSNEKVS